MRGRNSWLGVLSGLFLAAADAQSVIYRGYVYTPQGDASLQVDSQNRLVVRNIGDGGDDGFLARLGRANAYEATLVPLSPGRPVGAGETWTAFGRVAGVDDLEVARLAFTRTASGLRLEAAFQAFGIPPKTVEVYAFDVLVGSVSLVSGPQVATLPEVWPSVMAVHRSGGPQQRPTLVARWPAPVPFVLPGGLIVSGNEIRVLAMIPNNTLEFVADVGGTGSDVPELFVSDAHTEPTCPGDLNGDGVVDIADLAILLANFGAQDGVSAAEGDLDGDGDVDVTDLAMLLANFGTIC